MQHNSFPPPIIPATISVRDGALYSDQFGDTYHSVEGGIEEARHVFLAGNELPTRWRDGGPFTIVETGFGCGLNFLATWDAVDRSSSDTRLDFVSVEKHPLRRDDLAKVLQTWPQFEAKARKLLDVYPSLAPGYHRLHLGSRVTLTLLFGDALEQLGELDARADAFFLDGFAPSRNPEMWSEKLFSEIGRLAGPGATASTYSVAGKVKQGLGEASFDVKKRAGFAQKREMLVARFPGQRPPSSRNRKVVVIGAGIAGTSCALALARRGVEVELLERASRPGAETSSNPAAVVRPFMTLDNGARSRFGWSAFSYAVRLYRELNGESDFRWKQSGVLQLAQGREHLERLVRAIGQGVFPHDLVRLVDASEGTELCGVQVREAGIWFPSAGYLDGRPLCNALVERGGQSITFHPSVEAERIRQIDGCTQVFDAGDNPLAYGDQIILANGCRSQALVPNSDMRLRSVRGQVTGLLRIAPELTAPVCRDGYITPGDRGAHYVGGTFDEESSEATVTDSDHEANVLRAAYILPSAFEKVHPKPIHGWAGMRCVSRDRLPALGEIDGSISCCVAMGSRGFNWAPLAGEMLASLIAGAPCPVERSVAKGLLPQRFV